MSYNFGHEITRIRDLQLRALFAFDHFHDSLITSVRVTEKNSLEMTFACEREWKSAGVNTALAEDERFQYEATFGLCQHFEVVRECPERPAEFINSRFKDSVSLSMINKKSQHHHYHLRMALDDGFIDIIFRRFAAISQSGAAPRGFGAPIRKYSPFCIRMKDENSKLARLAQSDDRRAGDALMTLFHRNNRRAISIARANLDSADMGIWTIAVFIIGRAGSRRDLELLMGRNDHTRCHSLARRHRDDAVEQILHRASPS